MSHGPRPGLDVAAIRAQFPVLSRKIGEAPLVWLDSAATSQKPWQVLAAVSDYYAAHNANIHRAVHRLGEEATEAWEGARERVRRRLGAKSVREVVFTRGTTEAINLVAGSWGGNFLKEGDVILLSEMEHHSNIVPWQLVAARTGARLSWLPVEPDGTLDLERAARAWDPRTRIVGIAHMSNVLGTINDVAALATLAHRNGALVLVDAAQSLPHLDFDVAGLGADFLAFSGHKAYAPMGIGALWAREELLEAMPPWQGGGDMISSVTKDGSSWNDLPWKFEAGTPDVGGAVGLAAALDWLDGVGLQAVGEREDALTAHALSTLGAVEGLRLYGRAPRRGGVFSFTLEGAHPHDLAQFLDREGIAVRAGHHCAQPLHRALGIPATTRASLAFWNTEEEIDLLAEALGRAREFWR